MQRGHFRAGTKLRLSAGPLQEGHHENGDAEKQDEFDYGGEPFPCCPGVIVHRRYGGE